MIKTGVSGNSNIRKLPQGSQDEDMERFGAMSKNTEEHLKLANKEGERNRNTQNNKGGENNASS